MKDRSHVVGDNLKWIRTTKKLSLTQTAAITGVSKSMLSSIEAHKKSPTVALLYTIAEKLDISPIELILERSTDDSDITVGNTSEVVRMSSDFYSSVMFGANTDHRFSVYKYILAPHEERVSSEPHGSKWEYCLALKGSLQLEVQGKEYLIEERDMVWFPTYLKHIYRNPSDEQLEMLMFTFFT